VHQGLKAPGNIYGGAGGGSIFVAQAIFVYLLCWLVAGKIFSGTAEGEHYRLF